MGTRVKGLSRSGRLVVSVVVVSTALAFLPAVSAPQQAAAAEAVALPALVSVDRVDVRTRWSSVEFAAPFAQPPVVVAGPASWRGRDPVTIRVRNVTTTGFEIRLTEWPYLDGNHTVETVSYLAIPAGRHSLASGAVIEAGTSVVADAGSEVSFATPFLKRPILLATVADPSSGPALAVRTTVRTARFSVVLDPEEADDGLHSAAIHWVAWSTGSDDGADDGFAWETHKKAFNNSFARVFFDRAYVRPCVLADMNTVNGGDTANLRYRKLWPRSVRIRVDEEQSANPEVAHVAERVGLLVLECANQPPTITPGFGFGATLVGTPTVLSGWAFDDLPVVRVSIAVRHRDSGEWLQADGSFGSGVRRFDAELTERSWYRAPDTWRLEVALPDGDYSLSVRVWDADGNEVPLSPWHHFSVLTSPTASGIILDAAGDVGWFSSLELDAAGNPVIAYLENSSGDSGFPIGDVKVIHCADPSCAVFSGPFAVAPAALEPLDERLDLELDAAGNPVIAFGGTTVHCVDANCEQPASVVEGVGGATLEIDASGNPVSWNGQVVHCTDPNCVNPPIRGSNYPPEEYRWGDLALDAVGNPIIATWEWSDELGSGGDLDLIHCTDPNCENEASFEVVTDEGFSEHLKTVSLQLDALGNPVMAVKQENPEDYTMDRLRVITCSDSNCTGSISIHEIEDNLAAGLHSSLALSPFGFPVVAYDMAYPDQDLVLARCTDARCAEAPRATLVDNNLVFAEWISLAVDDSGTAYISYYDKNEGDLRFARVPAP